MPYRAYWRLLVLALYFVLLISQAPSSMSIESIRPSSSQLTISDNPSAVTIKVGDEATIKLTIAGEVGIGQVCFSEEGFPTTGFTLNFTPPCSAMQQPVANAQLIVEATPAAAPQNFTALIVAGVGNETATTPLTITVVPAISPWIPWLGILLFFLVIGAALFIKPRRSKSKGKGKMDAK